MRILGVDPGSQVIGFAVIEFPDPDLIYIDAIHFEDRKEYPDFFSKVKKIYKELGVLICEYQPEVMAIESPFYGKNAQSMLKLGQIQGVCFTLALQYGLEIQEYKPRQVKRAITGNGNASKEQVQRMLKYYFPDDTKFSFQNYDASDALAIALTCGFYMETTLNR